MAVSDDSTLSYLAECAQKCASEQQWAVASVTAVDAAFVAGAERLAFPLWLSILASVVAVLAAILAIRFVRYRHGDYYFYRDAIAALLEDARVPSALRERAPRDTPKARSGVRLYCSWIIISSVFAIIVLVTEGLTRRCSEALAVAMTSSQHVYELRPRKDRRVVHLISDALPFSRLWYAEPNAISNAIEYAKFRSPLDTQGPTRRRRPIRS